MSEKKKRTTEKFLSLTTWARLILKITPKQAAI